ncbi:MAG: hypothetical protein AAB553_00465 [Patescibacteria group bacterium]
MNTASISIKTEPKIKAQVQEIANELGISMTGLISSYLAQLVKNKSLVKKLSENPTPYLLESIKIARRERKTGKASPIFTQAEDAIKWLNS